MEVLAAVQGRTAKGLTQVYQSFFRLEQLVMEIVTPTKTNRTIARTCVSWHICGI